MIRVKNIYYMLAYAYKALNESGYDNIAAEDFENIQDLIACILARGIAQQIKQGFHRDYQIQMEPLGTLRGKIDMSASIKQQTALTRRMVCRFDIYSENTMMNRILKTTALILMRSREVRIENRQALKKLLLYFDGIALIDPFRVDWSVLRFHRNNASYKMLMNICYLVLKGLLLTTEAGGYKLAKYLDDQQMSRLYEKFVLGYYRREHPKFGASATYIDWHLDNISESAFLPQMHSDITLSHGGRTLIIDTKYYGKSMQNNPQYNKATVISGNLYQIFAYVKNKDRDHRGNVSGILLYAKTDDEITPNFDYSMSGNRISAKTLDLGADWADIRKQLEEIAGMLIFA